MSNVSKKKKIGETQPFRMMSTFVFMKEIQVPSNMSAAPYSRKKWASKMPGEVFSP